jgi:hypothetical protein
VKGRQQKPIGDAGRSIGHRSALNGRRLVFAKGADRHGAPASLKKQTRPRWTVAAGLEHFILADGFGNMYTASSGRAASAYPFDALLRLSALNAEEGASC